MAGGPTVNLLPGSRVPLIDQRTGLINTSWYRFFLSLFDDVGGVGDDIAASLLLPPPTDVGALVAAGTRALAQAPSSAAWEGRAGEIQKALDAIAMSPLPQPPSAAAAAPVSSSSLRAMHFQRSGPLTLFADTPLELVWESTYQEPGTAALQMTRTDGFVTATSATAGVFSFRLYLILDAGADIEAFFNLCDLATPPNGNVDDFEMPAYANVTASRAGRWIVPSPGIVRMQTGGTRARVRVTIRTAPGTPQLRCTGASLVVTQEK